MIGLATGWLSAVETSVAREAMHPSQSLDGEAKSVKAVAFSPNGRWIAAAMPGSTKIWEVATAKLSRVFEGSPDEWARGVAFAPSGDELASITEDHAVSVWRVQSGERLLRFETEGEHLTSIAFSPDGRRIITAARHGLIEIWSAQSGERLRALYCPDFDHGVALAVAATPDDRIISVGTMVCSWNRQDVEAPSVRYVGGQAVAVSPDGNWVGVLTTPSPFFVVKLWSMRSDKVFGHLGLGGAAALGFSTDGARLCAGGDRLSLWDLTRPELVSIEEIRSGYEVRYAFAACAFSSDRRRLVAADDESGRLTIWNIDKAGSPRGKLLLPSR